VQGGTYGGSTLGCAAAVATIDTITEEHLLENAQQRGLQLARGMIDLAQARKAGAGPWGAHR
jgi:4-aminobutyrate aminotransferase-like enzyme